VIIDNIAFARRRRIRPIGSSLGSLFQRLRPGEAHKGVPASMVYHLAQQMKAGQRPQEFSSTASKNAILFM